MKLTLKARRSERSDKPVTEATPIEDPSIVETERWTHGQTLKNRAITAGVLLGTLALVVGASVTIARATTPDPVVINQAKVDIGRTDQSGPAYARAYLKAWLGASKDHHEDLDAYTDSLRFTSAVLPQKPLTTNDIAVVASSPRPEGLQVVTLAAELGEAKGAQRYFEVVLASPGGKLAAAALPREIPAPEHASTALPGYKVDATADERIRQSLNGFFAAYLAGDGDLQRFLKPGSALLPITPAPYTQAKVIEVSSSETVPETPTEGTSLQLLVRVQAIGANGYQLSTDYELTITARAGRWEISSMGTPTEPHTSTTQEQP